VHDSWCKRKLGLTDDAAIDAAIKEVAKTMHGDHDKSAWLFIICSRPFRQARVALSLDAFQADLVRGSAGRREPILVAEPATSQRLWQAGMTRHLSLRRFPPGCPRSCPGLASWR